MTAEGRLRRGKENYESRKRKLMNNPETLAYIKTLPKEEEPEGKPEEEKSGNPNK